MRGGDVIVAAVVIGLRGIIETARGNAKGVDPGTASETKMAEKRIGTVVGATTTANGDTETKTGMPTGKGRGETETTRQRTENTGTDAASVTKKQWTKVISAQGLT